MAPAPLAPRAQGRRDVAGLGFGYGLATTQAALGRTLFDLDRQAPAAGRRHEGCAAPSVGDCGSCTVSCPVGAAATCKPGKISAAMGDGSCQREPSCTCVSSAPSPKK